MDDTIHIPKSVNQPNINDRGTCNSCIRLKFFRSRMICPAIRTQFQIISQVPIEKTVYLILNILATDEIGEIPNSACFVNATPIAAKNRLTINNR